MGVCICVYVSLCLCVDVCDCARVRGCDGSLKIGVRLRSRSCQLGRNPDATGLSNTHPTSRRLDNFANKSRLSPMQFMK